MNGKSYEGLTFHGMAAQIANAILLWKSGAAGTKNDCKLTIANVVRAFQERLIATKDLTDIPYTQAAYEAELEGESRHLEHAIPVACLMNVLFHYVGDLEVTAATAKVEELIRENTILAWVTPEEHAKLNGRLAHCMPDAFSYYPWADRWARYLESGVQIPQPVLQLQFANVQPQ
jgi:hypothetical protein